MKETELPYDELAERTVLGSLIKNPDFIPEVLEVLREEDFFDKRHRGLFKVLVKLYEDKGSAWDEPILRSYLRREGLEDEIPMSFIMALVEMDAVEDKTLLMENVRTVKDYSDLRRLLILSTEVENSIREGKEVSSVLNLLKSKLEELEERRSRGEVCRIDEVVDKVLKIVEDYRNRETLVSGLPTGFVELDRLTSGFHEGDFVVIAGRPGMGKTSFMLSIALNLLRERGEPVLIFSLEMPKEQLTLRLLSMLSGIPLTHLRSGNLTDEQFDKLLEAGEKLSQYPLFIDDSPSLNSLELRLKAKQLKKEEGIKVLFLDYLQLLRPPQSRGSRQEEVAEVSRSLKATAKELSLPVVALAQLSRQVEQRTEKKPQLADLRESGQIEQDADLIIFLHRPEYYKKNPSPEEIGKVQVIVAKQRNGPTDTITLKFEKELTAFRELSQLEREEEEEREVPPPDDFSDISGEF